MSKDLNKTNRASWQRVAHEYSGEQVAEDDVKMREFIRNAFCERLNGTKILEVGCGPGTDAAKFTEMGLNVIATDYSVEFIKIVNDRYPNLETHVMDMTKPDLPSASFNGVYGFGSFIHLPRQMANSTLTSLRKLLVPGGVLCLQLISSSKDIREYTIDNWVGDPLASMLFTCYEKPCIRTRLIATGFSDIEFIDFPPCIYDKIPRLIERGIQTYIAFARQPNE
ncbi:MAG: class I SAM-dependent methyltransferase [Candidatus Rifleibacteriota bacterium]